MHSLKAFFLGTAATLSFGIGFVTAMPAQSDDITVYVRDTNFAYHPSEEMAHAVRARNADDTIAKRSYATVQACYTSSCTDCYTVFNAAFVTSTSCISAENTACLIISNLENAHVHFWSHAGCNENMSQFNDCPAGTNNVAAPGTESIGIHTGCQE